MTSSWPSRSFGSFKYHGPVGPDPTPSPKTGSESWSSSSLAAQLRNCSPLWALMFFSDEFKKKKSSLVDLPHVNLMRTHKKKHFLQFCTSVRYCCDGAGGEARFSGTAQLAWNKETSESVPPTLGSQMGNLEELLKFTVTRRLCES